MSARSGLAATTFLGFAGWVYNGTNDDAIFDATATLGEFGATYARSMRPGESKRKEIQGVAAQSLCFGMYLWRPKDRRFSERFKSGPLSSSLSTAEPSVEPATS